MNTTGRYIVIPALFADSWDTLLDYAWCVLGISGNEFMGSHQYNSPTGNIAFKLV